MSDYNTPCPEKHCQSELDDLLLPTVAEAQELFRNLFTSNFVSVLMLAFEIANDLLRDFGIGIGNKPVVLFDNQVEPLLSCVKDLRQIVQVGLLEEIFCLADLERPAAQFDLRVKVR